MPDRHDRRWRPADRKGRTCGYTFDQITCKRRGAHYCRPRADKVVAFFAELLVHTKGPHQRTAFVLADWQEHEIVRPLFGEVAWSSEWGCYVRRYRIAYIVVARKNGKSELAAGMLLYLLIGDDEQAAEIYSAAADTKQAGKVFEPAARMVQLSKVLSRRLRYYRHARRIVDEKTASWYEIITADAKGELGHNPHGFNLDEVLSQRDGSLWEAMTTAAGARLQELMFATTTETNEATSFGADLIDEAERIQDDPARAPHIFSFVRKFPRTDEDLRRLHKLFPRHRDLPISADVWDEANWRWPNPGLDDFKSRDALRRAALEARSDALRENGFRQFHLNQRVQQTSRWMPMHLYDAPANTGQIWTGPGQGRAALAGRECWAGFDLAAKFDLVAWCLLFPPPDDGGPADVLWRFWLPEAALEHVGKHGNSVIRQWARDGWITPTEGTVIDYQRIYDDIAADGADFAIRGADCDEWSMHPVIAAIADRTGLSVERGEITAYKNTYDRMTPGLSEVMALVRQERFRHHANPVARWCFDNVEVRRAPHDPELIRPDKPERGRTGKRIDAVPVAAMAAAAWKARGQQPRRTSAYEDGHGLMIV